MRVPEVEEREKRAESLFEEIMAENFPNLGRHMDIQVHEAHRSLNKLTLRVPLGLPWWNNG